MSVCANCGQENCPTLDPDWSGLNEANRTLECERAAGGARGVPKSRWPVTYRCTECDGRIDERLAHPRREDALLLKLRDDDPDNPLWAAHFGPHQLYHSVTQRYGGRRGVIGGWHEETIDCGPLRDENDVGGSTP